MKTNLNISARIILLFTVAIFSTFIGDKCHNFLGDTKCEGGKYERKVINHEVYHDKIGCDVGGEHAPTWHWGYRHWIYVAMCFVLFIFQCINLFLYIESIYKKQL